MLLIYSVLIGPFKEPEEFVIGIIGGTVIFFVLAVIVFIPSDAVTMTWSGVGGFFMACAFFALAGGAGGSQRRW